jgi:VWA domain-containing protein
MVMLAAALTFLTPVAGLFALTALLPLGVFLRRSRRAAAVRHAIGLGEPRRRTWLPIAICLAGVPALLGVASAQPVIGTTRSIPERVDAQTFFVLDTSRSMLASKSPGSPTRFDRARRIAEQLRDRIPQVPAGLVSMTDRLLPHAFPTTDRRVFVATLRQSLGVELPPPTFTYNTQATWLGLLAGIPERHYFPKSTTKRVVVVLTDGESRPFGSELSTAYQARPRVQTIWVHVWGADEAIYETGLAEGAYKPQPTSSAAVKRAAELTAGRSFEESQTGAAGDELVRMVGSGETRSRTIAGSRLALMPYLALAAFLPLGFVLWRRNR